MTLIEPPDPVATQASPGPRRASIASSPPARATTAHVSGPTEIAAALGAARRASELGRWNRALGHGRRALTGLAKDPDARWLRVQLLCELARLQWQADGPGPEFTLDAALATIREACALLDDAAPAGLRSVACSTLAGICYDQGDPQAIAPAIDAVVDAIYRLERDGDVIAAARLRRDLASLQLRLGDAQGAEATLLRVRDTLTTVAPGHSAATFDLAATEHLLARIPLHSPASNDAEPRVLAEAVAHGTRAAALYARLDCRVECARVEESLARLAMRAGDVVGASARLRAVVATQTTLGDTLGLARSTSAMAELLARAGHDAEALALLGDAAARNLAKRSPIGLAFVERGVDSIARHVPASAHDAAALARATALLELIERGAVVFTAP